jgi:hypothetical protein
MDEFLANTPFGDVRMHITDNKIFIHFKYTKGVFALSDYKEMLLVWDCIIKGLKDVGAEEVFSCISLKNKKLNKFLTMFGFSPDRENKEHIVYRRVL